MLDWRAKVHSALRVLSRECRQGPLFLTYEALVQRLLGPNPYENAALMQNLPSLLAAQYVLDLNTKLNCYIGGYLATRAFICLSDLEDAVGTFLQPLRLQPLESLLPSEVDPSELDLDDLDSSSSAPAGVPPQSAWRFESLGLGALRCHPALAPHFPSLPTPGQPEPAREPEVLCAVAEYLGSHTAPLTAMELAEALRAALCRAFGVRHLACAGLALQPLLLPGAVLALKEALRFQPRPPRAAPPSSTLAEVTSAAAFDAEEVAVHLRPSAHEGLEAWLLALAARLGVDKKKPSQAKVRAAVAQQWVEAGAAAGSLTGALGEALSDYAFLRLGSSRVTRKRLEITRRQRGEADGEAVYEMLAAEQAELLRAPKRLREAADGGEPAPAPASLGPENCRADEQFETRLRVPPSPGPTAGPPLVEEVPAGVVHAVLQTCVRAAGEDVGRFGERLVAALLAYQLPASARVSWVNAGPETTAPYDLMVKHGAPGGGHTDFVEVKTSRFLDKNAFEISPNEWRFAEEVHRAGSRQMEYHLYRVLGVEAGRGLRVLVVRDLLGLVQTGRGRLCLAL